MPAAVILALLLVPILEIYAIVQVGQTIGAGPTVLLLIADSVLGAWLVRREGRRAWAALQQSMTAGGMPSRELADGALVLVGGTLLLTPGFLTDIVGFFLLLPFTRPIARKALIVFATRWFGKAVAGSVGTIAPGMMPPGMNSGASRGPRPGAGRVVRGEVADDDEESGR